MGDSSVARTILIVSWRISRRAIRPTRPIRLGGVRLAWHSARRLVHVLFEVSVVVCSLPLRACHPQEVEVLFVSESPGEVMWTYAFDTLHPLPSNSTTSHNPVPSH